MKRKKGIVRVKPVVRSVTGGYSKGPPHGRARDGGVSGEVITLETALGEYLLVIVPNCGIIIRKKRATGSRARY